MKVLIVDDSKALRERLVEMLSQVTGLEIVGQAKNGAEASQALSALAPNLVVLDLQMPDGSGIELLSSAKQNHPDLKVIIFTNHPEAQYRQRCAALGADFFLCKSTDSKLLIEICRQLAGSEVPRHESNTKTKREPGDNRAFDHKAR